MARSKVKVNPRGVEDVFSQWAAGDGQTRMLAALSSAIGTAPVVSGAYKASLRLETVEHSTRTVVRLVSDSPYAMTVEAAHGVLARALDAAGGNP